MKASGRSLFSSLAGSWAYVGHTGFFSMLLVTARQGTKSVCDSGTPTILTCPVSSQLILQLVQQEQLTSGVRAHFTLCSSEWGFRGWGAGAPLCLAAHLHAVVSHRVWWLPPVHPPGRPGGDWGLGKPRETLNRKWRLLTQLFGGGSDSATRLPPAWICCRPVSMFLASLIQSQMIRTRIWNCDHSQHPACLRQGLLHYSSKGEN